jgi:hypothetical protein
MTVDSFLNGSQLEQWVSKQAKDFKKELPFSLKEMVEVLDNKLPTHFTRSIRYLIQEVPSAEDWIKDIRSGQRLNLAKPTEQAFKERILDLALATDFLLEFKDKGGTKITVAVDVTSDTGKERDKLLKIRGQSSQGSSHFEGFPDARKELNIDKHCILLLNSNKELLPSKERLLSELYNFAISNSKTQSINLSNVPEQDRFDWSAPRQLNPQEMWSAYSKVTPNIRLSPQVSVSACVKALTAGYSKPDILSMLQHDPQVRNLQRHPDKANDYVEKIFSAAQTEFLKPLRSLLNICGNLQPDGQRLFNSDTYQISGSNDNLQILRKRTGEPILNVEGASVSSKLTYRDIKILFTAAQFAKQRAAEANQPRNQPQARQDKGLER